MKKKASPPTSPPGSSRALSPGLVRFLYLTAGLTGAAIMIVEILGAKMLAPYVGTSHFVWTAQIAITMVALATGYYAGGRWVDASSRLGRLYAAILAAGIYLAATIPAVQPVAYGCLRFSLPVGTLLASLFLYFIPLGLLAMTGPFMVRVLTHSVEHVGSNMGGLTAISTLGSFAGTVLVGYVLIPLLPNSITMFLIALGLIAVSATYFLMWARQRIPAVLLAVLAGTFIGYWGIQVELHPEFKSMEVHAYKNSPFGTLQVLHETAGSRQYYLNDYLVQNTYDTLEKKSFSMFTFMLHDLAVAYTPRTDRVLCIGMGIGIVPMHFARDGASVDVVEINPAVIPLAQAHFDFEPERFRIVLNDGRYFLNQCRTQYHAIILDAFLGDSSPSHLMTREAFQSMADHLEPEGVLVMNCFGDFEPGKDFMVASLYKTLSAVFPSVRIHNDRNGGNVFFVASPRPALAQLRQPDFTQLHPAVRGSVQAAFARRVETNPDHGIVLTDDYNPVEAYDARNREAIRKNLTSTVRFM